MKFKPFNRATAAIVAAALVTILGAVVVVDEPLLGAIQSILTVVLSAVGGS